MQILDLIDWTYVGTTFGEVLIIGTNAFEERSLDARFLIRWESAIQLLVRNLRGFIAYKKCAPLMLRITSENFDSVQGLVWYGLLGFEMFNNKEFHGTIIDVLMAESKNSHNMVAPLVEPGLVSDVVPDESTWDMSEGGGQGRGRGDASGNAPPKAWQQYGDWMCPNTRSVI